MSHYKPDSSSKWKGKSYKKGGKVIKHLRDAASDERKENMEKLKQRINREDFEGKTIERIDFECVNYVVFHFTDGTSQVLETALMGASVGLWGIVQT